MWHSTDLQRTISPPHTHFLISLIPCIQGTTNSTWWLQRISAFSICSVTCSSLANSKGGREGWQADAFDTKQYSQIMEKRGEGTISWVTLSFHLYTELGWLYLTGTNNLASNMYVSCTWESTLQELLSFYIHIWSKLSKWELPEGRILCIVTHMQQNPLGFALAHSKGSFLNIFTISFFKSKSFSLVTGSDHREEKVLRKFWPQVHFDAEQWVFSTV